MFLNFQKDTLVFAPPLNMTEIDEFRTIYAYLEEPRRVVALPVFYEISPHFFFLHARIL